MNRATLGVLRRLLREYCTRAGRGWSQAARQKLARIGPLDVRSTSARTTMPPIFSGPIDLRVQAKVLVALRSDTPV
jgi:hypothetical protein